MIYQVRFDLYKEHLGQRHYHLIFEVNNLLQGFVAFENSVLFVLLLMGIWKTKFTNLIKQPYFLAALVFIISLAVLIAFSSPNFGTLSRYKVAYWPFFVMLVLGAFLKRKKVRFRKT